MRTGEACCGQGEGVMATDTSRTPSVIDARSYLVQPSTLLVSQVSSITLTRPYGGRVGLSTATTSEVLVDLHPFFDGESPM